MMINIQDDVSQAIQGLEKDISRAQREENKAKSVAAEKQNLADSLYEKMGFRDRYLGGYFGGNRERVKEYRKAVSHVEEFNRFAAANAQAVSDFEQDLYGKIHTYLEESDRGFQELLVPWQAAKDLNKAVDSLAGKIRTALREIDDAQSVETADLLTNNAAISIWSSLENGEANDAIRRVKKAVPKFQLALEFYNYTMKNVDLGNIDFDVSDFGDLVFDLAFDGFDFMSIFVLSGLSDAEDAMEEALSKVKEVKTIADQNYDKANEAVTAYVDTARNACQSGMTNFNIT